MPTVQNMTNNKCWRNSREKGNLLNCQQKGNLVTNSHLQNGVQVFLEMIMRMKLDYSITAYTKINSKSIKDLNKKTHIMKLLRKNTEHFLT